VVCRRLFCAPRCALLCAAPRTASGGAGEDHGNVPAWPKLPRGAFVHNSSRRRARAPGTLAELLTRVAPRGGGWLLSPACMACHQQRVNWVVWGAAAAALRKGGGQWLHPAATQQRPRESEPLLAWGCGRAHARTCAAQHRVAPFPLPPPGGVCGDRPHETFVRRQAGYLVTMCCACVPTPGCALLCVCAGRNGVRGCDRRPPTGVHRRLPRAHFTHRPRGLRVAPAHLPALSPRKGRGQRRHFFPWLYSCPRLAPCAHYAVFCVVHIVPGVRAFVFVCMMRVCGVCVFFGARGWPLPKLVARHAQLKEVREDCIIELELAQRCSGCVSRGTLPHMCVRHEARMLALHIYSGPSPLPDTSTIVKPPTNTPASWNSMASLFFSSNALKHKDLRARGGGSTAARKTAQTHARWAAARLLCEGGRPIPERAACARKA
jgi:hypothetical protein